MFSTKQITLFMTMCLVLSCASMSKSKKGSTSAGSESGKSSKSGKSAKGKTSDKAGQTPMAEDGEEFKKEDSKPSHSGDGKVVTCAGKGDERTLTLAKSETGGCEVIYRKLGQDQVLANGSADATYCQSVIDRVKGNLEKAGYTCTD